MQTRCPASRSYTEAEIRKAGAELRKLLDADPKAVTPGMIADYKLLRDQCRATAK
ncbi:hypothetical protein ACQR1Y_12305 [Bradyrhizobium sp. HKCCYLRH3099]|uniref:hypothetical protein n=1 Tax=unclassified Bradyrhizobium TaxID=2631580 RepID=UPI003EC015C1